ncbi:GNAT family N-acetyltransferase [Microbispora sp. NPDC049125]|uniref:GNAT family N-acetyltransferase n=1 Tax=Microbispora sp. NPDC049125 TaxID=3154929 RepID=UPI003466EE0F
MTPYVIRRARRNDVRAVSALLAASAAWMRQRGSQAWPPGGFPDERILLDIGDGTCWLLMERSTKAPVATLVLDARPDAEFIAAGLGVEGQPVTEALLVHKMAVDRNQAGKGIGGLLLDWVCAQAAQAGKDWVWINVARDNRRLQAWYISNGFEHMTTVNIGRPSGSLWRRAAERQPRLKQAIREAGL